MTNLNHLRELYADRPRRRPQPGETVTCYGLPGLYTVVSCDGSLYTLRSRHGVTLRAGVLCVRPAEQDDPEPPPEAA